MEAPVPASALIHSATLVSAGIYLLLRFNSLFVVCPHIAYTFSLITSFTAFYGAIIAAFQTDVKKVLAYSTISHCGLLMFSILMHSPHVTIFYLFAHGFFKSLNFMCVGNFIQYANNYQDVSRMGRFFATNRFEFYTFCITLFNLSSSPLFFCFFSKHWLLTSAHTNGIIGSLSVGLIYSAAFCGLFYSSKLLYECTLSTKRAHRSVYEVHVVRCHAGVYRRSNFISRLSIGLLYIAAFCVLYLMWAPAYAETLTFSNEYNSIVSSSVGSSPYILNIFFSSVVSITGYCLAAFKRNNNSAVNWSLSFLVFCAICFF